MAKIVFLMIKNLILKFWVENSCFWKTFKLILMHFIHEIIWFECFLHNLLQLFKNSVFQNFNWLNVFFDRSKIPWFLIIALSLTRLMFNWCSINWNWKNFQFLCFLPNFFFHESFIFRIYMHCIFFFCINLVVLQSYFSLFTHITYIHFKLGTQLDLKIDWLIFESFVHFSICYFYVWTVENVFLRDMMDNNVQNIFSTWFEFKHYLFMSHIVSSLHLLKERIFVFMFNLNYFKFGLCIFPPPPKFSSKLFFPKFVLFFLYL